MVQLSTGTTSPARTGPGPVLTALGVLAGLACLALGLGLLRRVDSALGAVGACLFLVLALVIVNSCAILVLARLSLPVPAREHPGGGEVVLTRLVTLNLVGQTNLLLLGAWFAALGVVGALTARWAWAVVAVVPAVYFLGFPVLFATGRLRPGGVTLTGTSMVDQHFGVRTEVGLSDVVDLDQRADEVVLTPRDPDVVRRTHLTPRPWRARTRGDRVVVAARELPGGADALAELLRARLPRR